MSLDLLLCGVAGFVLGVGLAASLPGLWRAGAVWVRALLRPDPVPPVVSRPARSWTEPAAKGFDRRRQQLAALTEAGRDPRRI